MTNGFSPNTTLGEINGFELNPELCLQLLFATDPIAATEIAALCTEGQPVGIYVRDDALQDQDFVDKIATVFSELFKSEESVKQIPVCDKTVSTAMVLPDGFAISTGGSNSDRHYPLKGPPQRQRRLG